ncbi:bacteriocin [Streptococcus marmotae]|uniref:bacteriocin n=1 Tax=Streptococcus marmotae TaxID=1825069 RepID=UPI000829D125|nr:bacteriocin [Streptococcus marmotae]
MNTQIISQFKRMDIEQLTSVEGGEKVGVEEFVHVLAVCTAAGAAGSVFPVVGTLGEAILGAQYCTGTWAIIRAN